MQVIYKCNVCNSEKLDIMSVKFNKEIKHIQKNDYNYQVCRVLFICTDCGKTGEEEFISLERIIENL